MTANRPDTAPGLGDPACPLCGGLGFVRADVNVGDPQFGRIVPCTCRLPEMQHAELQRLRQLGNLDALADKTFDTFLPEGVEPNPERRAKLRAMYEACHHFAHAPEGRWLLLVGSYGCGKTHLAAAIANARIERGQPALFVNAPDFLDYLRAAFAPGADESYAERFELVRNVSLLVLDDLGAESPTPWANEKLYQLLNHRYNAHLPTVITTNHDPETFDPRLTSRLADQKLVTAFRVTATDMRGGAPESPLSRLHLFKRFTFESFVLRTDLNGADRKTLLEAWQAAQAYADDPQGWLVFMGPSGVGKTHLAAAIAQRLQATHYPHLVFVNSRDVVRWLRPAFGETFAERQVLQRKNEHALEAVLTADFAVIDDWPEAAAHPTFKERLFDIVAHRFEAELPTVWTTLHDLSALDPRTRTRFINPMLSKLYVLGIPPYLERKKK